jgi:hypothetical protein
MNNKPRFRPVSRTLSIVLALCMFFTPLPASTSAGDTGVNYARLLQYLLYFYDANMCGPDVSEASGMTWRGNCHVQDAEIDTPFGIMDLSGGFHDSGDHIKFGVPAALTAMTLGLSYHEFKDAFVQTGQDEHMEIILKRFAVYFKKCTVLKEDGSLEAYAYQVGDGRDHAFWGGPEAQCSSAYPRVAYFITPSHPGTDQLMAAAGALASSYTLFKDPEDLKYAKALYEAALSWPKFARGGARSALSGYSRSVPWGDANYADNFYQRYGDKAGAAGRWEDYGAIAAMWLYEGTGNAAYRDFADTLLGPAEGSEIGQDWFPFAWDSTFQMANFLRGNLSKMRADMYHVSDAALANPADFVFVLSWGSNMYNAGLQLMGLLHDVKATGPDAGRYSAWAKGQTGYIMGANKLNRCYVTGYADNSVKFTHHSGASGHTSPPAGSNRARAQLNLLVGALAGGPINASGDHNDYEDDYVGNEVSILYNAPFVGAVAGLYLKYGDSGMKPDLAIDSVKSSHIYPGGEPPAPLGSASSWAREGISGAIAKGFVPSDIQGSYQSIITRAEFCRMAVRWVEYAAGKEIDEVLAEKGLARDTNAFRDTDDPGILAAFALGITAGTGNNQFFPLGRLTRQQAAVMIMNTCRAVGFPGPDAAVSTEMPLPFYDIDTAANWARTGISFVQAHGIMSGMGNNNFSPNTGYTREQSIVAFNSIAFR